jgi:hypothetical protein
MELNIRHTTNATQLTGKLLANIFNLITMSIWRQQTVTFNDVPCGRVDSSKPETQVQGQTAN